MSQFGCYILDRLYCECGTCPACVHRSLMEVEKKDEVHKEAVGKAVAGFYKRVKTGSYLSPEKKREKAKKRTEDRQFDGFWAPGLFPEGRE